MQIISIKGRVTTLQKHISRIKKYYQALSVEETGWNCFVGLTPFVSESLSSQSGGKQGHDTAAVPKSQSRPASAKATCEKKLEFPQLGCL